MCADLLFVHTLCSSLEKTGTLSLLGAKSSPQPHSGPDLAVAHRRRRLSPGFWEASQQLTVSLG